MATATTNRTSTNRKTSTNAKATASSAKTTARNAKTTAKTASRPARREAGRAEQGVVKHSRRVAAAAQAEVTAVARTPYRPALFALGLVDRAVAGVKEVPSLVVETPTRARQRVVSVFATAGDLAEKAQQGYTEVAKDGSALVRAIGRQDSTQRAQRMAERARKRGQGAVRDTEKAVEAGTEAAGEALAKLG
ncbi:MAG TPA: hypothetical protein VM433_04720 [Mycobacteriales bacterium]|nr:hypothetical protein [Mycobacteriales bacterium]